MALKQNGVVTCLVDDLVATLHCLQAPGGWSEHVDQKGILDCALGVLDCERAIQEALDQGKVRLVPQLEAVCTTMETTSQDLHFRIAKRLLRSRIDDRITAQQFRFARELLLGEQPAILLQVVELCLEVGRQSAVSSQFDAATEYFELGIWVIENSNDPESWWKTRSSYRLTLSIYSAAAESNQAVAAVARALDLISCVQEHGRSIDDKLTAYTTKVTIIGQAGHRDEAIDIGVQVLRQMGHSLSQNPSLQQVRIAAFRLQFFSLVGERSKESILRIPDMTDESVGGAMRMLHLLFTYSSETRPLLMWMSALCMVKLTLQHGLCAVSAPAFAAFGVLLMVRKDPSKAENFLQLALDLQERYGRKEWLPRTYSLVYGVARGRSSSSLDHLNEAYHVGLETGDFEYAFIARQLHNFAKLFQGKTMTEIINDTSHLVDEAQSRNQKYRVQATSTYLRFVQLLAHRDTEWDPNMLTGEHGVSKRCPILLDDHLRVVVYKIELSYLFGEHQHVLRLSKNLPGRQCLSSHPMYADAGMFIEISRLIIQRKVGNRISSYLPCTYLNRLEKLALAQPKWCSMRLFLVQAERAWTQGNPRRAIFHYTNSLACSKFPIEHALVHQSFGRFFLESQRYPEAAVHMRKSLEAFRAVGANALVERMKKEISFVNRMDHGRNERSRGH